MSDDALIRPVEITLHSASRQLELRYADGREIRFSHEFLRVFSPSAEVRGHAPGQEVLQTGKKDVQLIRIEPVGHYALRLVFSDGHDSGLYSWAYLAELGAHQEVLWQDYLTRLQEAGGSREALPPPDQT
ncbi:MAG: DUF971 domain-containing protein [Proteobacteria bacterium]|nr:DUF971 domain-containing protein [Pseudomonadota bacterium]MCL2306644.1 DUF971 domain-containing protein [Pseudomonadota bacterium]